MWEERWRFAADWAGRAQRLKAGKCFGEKQQVEQREGLEQVSDREIIVEGSRLSGESVEGQMGSAKDEGGDDEEPWGCQPGNSDPDGEPGNFSDKQIQILVLF